MSAIFQCFLTAKYPITAANIKPIGTTKTPMLSIFYILQSPYVSIQFYISHKYSYRYQHKYYSKYISIITVLLQKINCISTPNPPPIAVNIRSFLYKASTIFAISSLFSLFSKITSKRHNHERTKL